MLLADAGRQARARPRARSTRRKSRNGCTRKPAIHIAFAHVSPAFRWYGPELYFERLELRSKDDQRVLARAAGGRVAADIWQLLRSGKLLAGRIEVDSPNIAVARLGPNPLCRCLGNRTGRRGLVTWDRCALSDLPAGKLVDSACSAHACKIGTPRCRS